MILNTTQKAAIAAIEGQQPKNKGTLWYCGEQLKEICRREEDSAALILEDVTKKGHGIADAEKKIREYAKGNGGGCSDYEAEGILRKFYGLREKIEDGEPAEAEDQSRGGAGKIIDLADYI